MKEPAGRVYILTNPRMQGLVKIGFTLGTVEGRAKGLDATGTPEPFEIAYQVEVRGPDVLERRAHLHLTSKRVRNSREFFEVDVVEAILCIRSLATEKLDEECNPKYIHIVDETAKRRVEERELKLLAEEAQRFEKIDLEAKKLQDKKNQLRSELEGLLIKADTGSELLRLNWLEANGKLPLLLLGLLFLILSAASLLAKDFLLSGSFAILASAFLIFQARLRKNAKNKEAHNFPILYREREIFNLKFDLEQLEKQKISLPRDLTKFVSVNPIRVDERGFESAAKVDITR